VRRLRSIGLAALALVLAGGVEAGNDPSFRAEVDATKVGVDDQFQLTVTLSGRTLDLSGEITPPDLLNLRILGGPSVSTQVSFVNGAMSQSRSYIWVLQGIAAGPASIGAVRATIGGQERTTTPIALEVVTGRLLAERQARRSPLDPFADDDPFSRMFPRRQAAPAEVKLFVEAVPSRAALFVGEPLLVTYYLFTQASVAGLELAESPSYPGFWAEELERPQQQPQGERVTRESAAFMRFPILQKLLFPTKAGSLTVPALSFRIAVPAMTRMDPFFSPVPGPNSIVTRASRPLIINAKPLPASPSFSGAVGSFRLTLTSDRQTLAIGDAASVRVRVEGEGNLKWVERGPELHVAGAKVYPPQGKSEIKTGPGGMSGSRTWDYVVVAETAGVLEIAPVSFEFFDPAAGRLVRRETAPLRLQVGTSASALPAQQLSSGNSVGPAAGKAELRLRSELEQSARLVELRPGTLLTLLVVAAFLHGGLFASPRLRRVVAGRGRLPMSTGDPRGALAALRRAARAGGSKEEAAALIEKALVEVFGDVDEQAPGELSERERALRSLMEEVRFIRYAPQLGDYSEKIREVSERAIDTVKRWS
jgi:hypothetical protein